MSTPDAASSPVPDGALLSVRGLHVSYGHVHAVRGISLDVRQGRIVSLIGPNGAGKSSTLAAISGLVPPRAGRVFLEGKEVTGAPAHQAVAHGLVLVPEGRAILARMTIDENLVLASESRPHVVPHRKRAARIEEQYTRFPVLGERRKSLAGTLSGGEQQMLAIARGLLARPRILMLDEPSMGLAPQMVERIFDLLAAIHREGTTLLLVEQNARMALGISDDAYVLERGEIALEGPARTLAADERVRAAYLGGDVA
jgi:branched-chain amino acid transport system ATP-binding protein